MLQHSKSLRTIRARTEEFCDKAKKKFSFSFKNDRDGKKNSSTSSTKSSFNKGNKDKNTIFVVIENYKALSQSHISVSKGQKVILLGNSSPNDENVNVALLPSENFLSPSNDTGIQGIIPMRILACSENENKVIKCTLPTKCIIFSFQTWHIKEMFHSLDISLAINTLTLMN